MPHRAHRRTFPARATRVNEPAIWWNFEPALDRRQYVQRVLAGYCRTPTCVGRARREDRRLAHRLYDQRIPLCLVQAAFILAAMRRLYRPLEAEPLSPVRSLHYFLPIFDEIRQQAIDPGYIAYAERKVRNADQELERIRKSLKKPSA